MATPVNMPQVGQDLETAVITVWHVDVGDQVEAGDIIAIVDSDKASFEVEVFVSGTVLKLLYDEGTEGRVFEPIAWIGEAGEEIPANPHRIRDQQEHRKGPGPVPVDRPEGNQQEIIKRFSSPAARRVAAERKIDISRVKPSGPNHRVIKKDVLAHASAAESVMTTPLAREMARVEGIELNEISGTGPLGRILKKDILNAARKHGIHPVADDEDEVVLFNRARKVIAERLSVSKLTIPHYYLNIDADLENALNVKKALLSENEEKVSVNDIMVYMTARVLGNYPWLNAHVDEDRLIIKKGVHMGIAVSTEAGLLVPVVAHADKKDLIDLSKEIKKLADNARRGIVTPVPQASFTISNLGMYGISGFQAIINPPQCAILSLGAIEKRIIPIDNGLKVTDMINIGMAVDHRAVDGAYAARFLNDLKTELMNFKI